MGYRSEVAIKCEAKAYEMFKDVFTKKELYVRPNKILKDSEYNDYIIYWDWIKWYEDYEGIKAITKVMNKLDELQTFGEDKGYGYRFMRLGENDDDVETRENNYDLELWMIRKIDIPEGLDMVNVDYE